MIISTKRYSKTTAVQGLFNFKLERIFFVDSGIIFLFIHRNMLSRLGAVVGGISMKFNTISLLISFILYR